MAFPTTEASATNDDVIENVETIFNELSGQEIPELLKANEDKFDGVVAEIENMQNDVTRFASSLKASLTHWTCHGKKGVWVKVPKEQAKLVPVAIEVKLCENRYIIEILSCKPFVVKTAYFVIFSKQFGVMSRSSNTISILSGELQEGFVYHHAESSYVMLVYWIPQTISTIPANASHQVGIAAFVFNRKGEVLVVQENCGPYKDSGLWKMPTGRIKQGEGIKEGAIREVKEETAIDTEFVEVVGFRDGHNAPFGKSDLLFLCMLKSLSSDIVIQETEISAAKWMAIDEFAAQPKNQQSKLLKDMVSVCIANISGQCNGFSAIDMPSKSRKPSVFYCNAAGAE